MFTKVYRKGYLGHRRTNTQQVKEWLGTHVDQNVGNVLMNVSDLMKFPVRYALTFNNTGLFKNVVINKLYIVSKNRLPNHHASPAHVDGDTQLENVW